MSGLTRPRLRAPALASMLAACAPPAALPPAPPPQSPAQLARWRAPPPLEAEPQIELHGEVQRVALGNGEHRPFHSYTMKQAIQEGFILDVLKHFTPVDSYYKLIKKIEGDPEFDTKRAKKKLRRYVEGHEHAIRLKAEIMVDHFHEQVLALAKIGGEARGMVVTSGIERAIQYYHAIRDYLIERKSPYQAI